MDSILDNLSRHNHIFVRVAVLALVILITLSIADTTLFLIAELATEEPGEGPEDNIVQQATGNETNLASLGKLNLFGKAAVVKPVKKRTEKAPETKMNLELQGVFHAEDPKDSSAIIAEKSKTGLLYEIGQRVPGNVTLNAVYANHVLLKRGAKLEKLSFSDEAWRTQYTDPKVTENEITVKAKKPRSKQTSARNTSARNISAQNKAQQNRAAVRSATPSTIGEYISKNRSRIESDPQSLLSELGMQAIQEGSARGYRVDGTVPNDLLKRAGLRQGDMILSVNGQTVGNVINDSQMVDSAIASGRVRVEVQRQDRRFFVTVPIK